MALRHEAGGFNGLGGINIHYETWQPELSRGAIIYVHGLGEHIGRYNNPIDYFGDRGFAAWGLDHRGHGRSGGQKGHIMAFGEYVADLKRFVELVLEKEPNRKVFMVGHSLGGLIAANYVLRYPDGLKGLVLSSPPFKIRINVPQWKVSLGMVFSAIMPRFTMDNELDPAGLSRDKAVVKAYIDDPLVHSKVSARFYVEMINATQRALLNAPKLKTPLLALAGGSDPIVDPDGVREFFDKAGSADKEFKLYEGFFHEAFNEIGKEKVFEDMEHWFDARL